MFIEHVRPLQGSASTFERSYGNCLPLIAMPHGMTHWTPQTSESNWAFHVQAPRLQGMRATHMPSPWIGDYGNFTVMPQSGYSCVDAMVTADTRSSSYRVEQAHVAPNLFKAHLLRYGITLEMAPTERCAVFRFTFPKDDDRAAVIVQPFKGDSLMRVDLEKRTLVGYTRANSGGCPQNFACWFVAEFDCPTTHVELFDGQGGALDGAERTGERVGARVRLDVTGGRAVTMRIATSFISEEQAWLNLRSEVGTASLAQVARKGASRWEKLLGRIAVEMQNEAQAETFYTCLYRALLFPRVFHEYDAGGAPQHYSPYSGRVEPGVMVTDNGFWDTFRTVYPLLALVYPDLLGEILEGWLASYREGGWLPKWASPGYRDCMIGTHMDAVFADAYVKGVRGFDVETAYAALRRHAFDSTPTGEYGREALDEYVELGYVPHEAGFHGVAARTQEYAYDDYCIAQLANALGHADDAQILYERARNYRKVFDPKVGLMRGRNLDGSWIEDWDAYAWDTRQYVEGSAWQYSWAVQQDPAGLIALHGGPKKLVAQLDKLMTLPPRFSVRGYPYEIHEMTEMAMIDGFGQYAHSNQPVHHVLYFYTSAGRPDRTQYWVRQVMERMYAATPTGLPGDEDNGEMSSWYVLNALGIFPLCPGHPSYVFGSPLVRRATVRVGGGRKLEIDARGNSAERVYVAGVKRNGARHDALWIDHETLAQGGTLTFTMSARPAQREYAAGDLPTTFMP